MQTELLRTTYVVVLIILLCCQACLGASSPRLAPSSSSSSFSSVIFSGNNHLEKGIYYDWDRQQTCKPLSYRMPKSEEELVSIIIESFKNQNNVKVVGAGHSFSGVQLTTGNMISLDSYSDILSITRLPDGNSLVEVQSGKRLRDLNTELEKKGLAILNLGATAAQSLAGATQTGTHGTGVNLGSMSTQIHSMRIIDSAGKIYKASQTQNKELFDAARVGLGAVGIVSTITLKTVPIWRMRRRQIPYNLDQLLLDLPQLMQKHARLQWFYTPYTNQATLLLRDDTNEPISPSGQDGGCWSTTYSNVSLDCVDVSYKVLVDSLEHYEQRPLYTEMEMFIPIEKTEEAMREFLRIQDQLFKKHDPQVQLFTGVRYVQRDDIYLSPMHGRDSSVISFIITGDKEKTGNPAEFKMFTEELERLCQSKFQGRPHWGKANYATGEYIYNAYPAEAIEAFWKVKKAMDPTDLFMNEYLNKKFSHLIQKEKVDPAELYAIHGLGKLNLFTTLAISLFGFLCFCSFIVFVSKTLYPHVQNKYVRAQTMHVWKSKPAIME